MNNPDHDNMVQFIREVLESKYSIQGWVCVTNGGSRVDGTGFSPSPPKEIKMEDFL